MLKHIVFVTHDRMLDRYGVDEADDSGTGSDLPCHVAGVSLKQARQCRQVKLPKLSASGNHFSGFLSTLRYSVSADAARVPTMPKGIRRVRTQQPPRMTLRNPYPLVQGESRLTVSVTPSHLSSEP